MCGSLALNMCGVACGRLDLCYEIGFGGPWYGLTKLIAVVFLKKQLHVFITSSQTANFPPGMLLLVL
jgi:fructose-1,6-bisphosphatase/inositol monophosphatase family enzyme